MTHFHFTLPASFLLIGSIAMGGEVFLHKWSGSLNVPDPVACAVDPQGRVYVTSTTRRKVGDLDIREHQLWIPDDVGLSSVEEKRAFLRRELAPGKQRQPRGGLSDHNKDGSIDWQDLTVHSERIYQLRDTDHDGTADKMTVFAEGFNTEVTGIAAGILYHDGWVYATIAPDLWRLRDTNDDGVADEREVMAHGFGIHLAYAGHDMHGPRLGPDGRIYWSIGDKGVNVTSKEGKQWSYPHEGCVMRVEPDGTGFEVFAHGLRNVQEIAFDDQGNIFGVDNDADMLGEKERLVYITEQSDSGWRCAHQYMKGESRWMRESIWDASARQPLFITPPLANYSNGPAGFVYEPGTALGSSLRGHFILTQFPTGKIDAFTIMPQGSAFTMSPARLIHDGVMAIGLNFGPDGALYTADWIGGYPLDEKGAIWRLDETDPHPLRSETQRLLSQGFKLTSLPDLKLLLGHADQRVRVAAQLELAQRQAWETLLTTLQEPTAPQLAKTHALWGLGIGLRRGEIDATALEPAIPGLLAPAANELLAQYAKIIGDAPAKVTSECRERLSQFITSPHARVRFQAAIAAGKLRHSAASQALWGMAERDGMDAWLRHAAVTGLAGTQTSEEIAPRLKSEHFPVRLVATLALARQRSALIASALQDTDPRLVDEAARAIHDDASIPEALPALASLIGAKKDLSEMTMLRALNANVRLGDVENAQRLLTAGLSGSKAALETLLHFAQPPQLDRVDGVARHYEPRDLAPFSTTLQPHVGALLALTPSDLKATGIALMIDFRLKVDAAPLRTIILDDKAKPALRVGALQLMAAQHASSAEFAATLTAAAQSTSSELQIEALTQSFTHQPDLAPNHATLILDKDGPLKVKQAALALLGTHPKPAAQSLMQQWLQRLADGQAMPGLKLDIIEAAAQFPTLADQLTLIQQKLATGLRDDLLTGGTAAKGKEIVTHHLGANCLACHTVEATEGSQVGPVLKAIGAQRIPAEILESLLTPAAKIVPGYGLVSLTTQDGTTIAGALTAEDTETLSLRLPDGTAQKISRKSIANQSPPISTMPPMLGILTPREIRDVMAYLTSLKGGQKAK